MKLTVERAEALVEEHNWNLLHNRYDGGKNGGCLLSLLAYDRAAKLGSINPQEDSHSLLAHPSLKFHGTEYGPAHARGLEAGFEGWLVSAHADSYDDIVMDPDFREGYRTGARISVVLTGDKEPTPPRTDDHWLEGFRNKDRTTSEEYFQQIESGLTPEDVRNRDHDEPRRGVDTLRAMHFAVTQLMPQQGTTYARSSLPSPPDLAEIDPYIEDLEQEHPDVAIHEEEVVLLS